MSMQKASKFYFLFKSGGLTPLNFASFNGAFEIAKCLIEAGANVNAKG